ncbi:efflux RND transporter permease subunit [Sulfurimonas lithotrophica]|uniref:Efflux RND transporter permease subunit n=1 Tax=Sulfurimonas lithotrophica TaxID=2590022 RepID=A0A5P8P092_9BACT|nr:efflux RND transporter permease subunit [Sulfurimonas lithotrophica]QFR49126.1 efflux RND transporter permease subunit [Sulfurimonas lithotrophica]
MKEKDLSNIKVTDSAGKLARGFLYNPLTAVLAIFLLAIGYISLEVMPREEDPQISISGGSIIIPAPGLKPKEIEQIIVEPLETKLREIKGIEHIYSMSMDNVAVVNVMYYIGQNREISNLKLYDKVMQNMDKLPKNIMQPLVKPLDIDIDIPILGIAFYQKNKSISYPKYLETIENLKKEISAINSVSKTELKGAHKAQYNVEVDLAKLKGYHLSLGQIVQGIKSIAVRVPSVSAPTKDNKLVIFGIKNAIDSIKDVENIMVAQYMGSPIYLRDVAKITDSIDIQNKQSAKVFFKDGSSYEQITLSVSKLAGTNAVFVADDVKELLEANKESLNKLGISYTITRNYGVRANDAVNELVHHLVITIVIIAVMLVFFLGWKESLIVTFTVPAILAITLFLAYMGDQTINRITLFAFLLSLGLLVDAAIIVIENIHRHMHAHDSQDRDIDELLINATDEIGAPTNVATLAIILTMVPMAFVGGMMGEFMKPIPLNVPVALLASLFIAYIFTPYLGRKLLHRSQDDSHKHTEKEAN